MKSFLTFLLVPFLTGNAGAQILGNIVSIVPDAAVQGQVLTTTITVPTDYFMMASPPCLNEDIYMDQGGDFIYSTQNFPMWPDYFLVDFTIPPNATPGLYDVYISGSTYDWQGCQTIGYWISISGFEVIATTQVPDNNWSHAVVVSPNPGNSDCLVSFPNPGGRQFRLTVRDGLGRPVKTEYTIKDGIVVKREDFPPGIYFYELEEMSNKAAAIGKIIFLE